MGSLGCDPEAVRLFIVAVSFVLGIVVVFGAFFGIGTMVAIGNEASLLVLGVLSILALLIVGAYLLTVFFVQFYAQAIVVDDLGAIAGIKHSFRCVRAHLVSTLGYSLLAGAIGVFFGLLGVAFSLLTMQPADVQFVDPVTSVGGILGFALVFVVLIGLFSGFMATYSVAFYREIRLPTVE